MSVQRHTLTIVSDLEIEMTRPFSVPRERLFAAFTDPALIPEWWGPATVTTIVDEADVRPGGNWRYVQRGADGQEYGFRGKYLELLAPERVVLTFEFEPMPGHVIVDTTTLSEVDGKTLLATRSRFNSIDDRDGMLATGMEAGAAESLDRLAALVGSE